MTGIESGRKIDAGSQSVGEGVPVDQVQRLAAVMRRLRVECPWDAEQTHRSLVTYLVEETAEVVDAIETGSAVDLREELGDLLLQVVFHAEIERQAGGFDLDDVAGDIADKLVRRHPHVFADQAVPDDLDASWEARKRAEKRRSSALEGIPTSLDTLARAQKVWSRAHSHGVELPASGREPGASTGTGQPDVTPGQIGESILDLVQLAARHGVDADQATREALRRMEQQVRDAERGDGPRTPAS